MGECSQYKNGKCASGWIMNAPVFCLGLVTDKPCVNCGESPKKYSLGIPSCMSDDPPAHLLDDRGLPKGYPTP